MAEGTNAFLYLAETCENADAQVSRAGGARNAYERATCPDFSAALKNLT